MSEKNFDELFQEDHIDIDFSKKIKRSIDKKIYIRIIISLIIICVAIVSIYKGISFTIDMQNYNPYSERRFLSDESKQGNEFQVLMTNYFQMTHPGMLYLYSYSDENSSIETQGFGQYIFKARIQSALEPICLGPVENITLKINRSHLEIEALDENIFISRIIDEFKNPSREEFQEVYLLSDIKKELQSLPDTSYIQVSISFNDYKTLEQTANLINKYPYSINWIALKDQEFFDSIQIAGGMSLLDTINPKFNDEFQEKYQNYILDRNEEMTAYQLQQNYLSKLKLFIDHPEFVKILNNEFMGQIYINQLKENYEKAQKEMLSYGINGQFHKKELLSIIENEDVSYIYIHDIKLSKYQK